MAGKNYSTQARPTPGVRGGQELFDTGQAYTRGTWRAKIIRHRLGLHQGYLAGKNYLRPRARIIHKSPFVKNIAICNDADKNPLFFSFKSPFCLTCTNFKSISRVNYPNSEGFLKNILPPRDEYSCLLCTPAPINIYRL